MAAELDKLSQYYISKGNTPRANLYAALAAEERADGTPETLGEQVNPLRRDIASQETSSEGGYTVRFASPEQSLQMQEQGEVDFLTQPITVSDIGDILLSGSRGDGLSIYKPVGMTVKDGALITREYVYLAGQEDLYELEVKVAPKQEIFLPPGRRLFAQMRIDGINETFEAELKHDNDDDGFFNHLHWYNSDSNDKQAYSFFASPNNTELLSKLSFSLYTKPQEL